ncbi:MAG: sulfotransferase [Pseudomonadota bacterium]
MSQPTQTSVVLDPATLGLAPEAQAEAAPAQAALDLAAFEAAYRAQDFPAARAELEARIAERPDPRLTTVLARVLDRHFNAEDHAARLLHGVILAEGDAAPPAAFEALAAIELRQGAAEAAIATAKRGLETAPDLGGAAITMLKARPLLARGLAPALIARLEDAATPPASRPKLHAALARAFDKMKRRDEAFAQAVAGARTASPGVDPAGDVACLRETLEIFTPDFVDARRGFGLDDPRPTFVVGLPRSGARLMSRFLAGHPDVADLGPQAEIGRANRALRALVAARTDAPLGLLGHLAEARADEVRAVATDCLARMEALAGGAPALRLVDSGAGLFAQVGLIKLMFPAARVIHMRRFALDVAIANLFDAPEDMTPFADGPESLVSRAIIGMEMMRRWEALYPEDVTLIQYERLKEDLGRFGALALHRLALALPADGLPAPRAADYEDWTGRWSDYRDQLAGVIDAFTRYEAAAGVVPAQASSESAATPATGGDAAAPAAG